MSKVIDPRPVLAGPESMSLDLGLYYARYPCIEAFLSSLSANLDVETALKCAIRFLAYHSHPLGTFNNYRTFVERLLLWSWIVAEQTVLTLDKETFTNFITFCKMPPSNWVGFSTTARFAQVDGNSVFNESWRPFNIRASKDVGARSPKVETLRFIRSVCSSFYGFLCEEDVIAINPAISSRTFYGRGMRATYPVERYLTSEQLGQVLQALEFHALGDPAGERALFIIAATTLMCLHAADLANADNYCPCMNCFVLDDARWWLILEAPGRLLRKVEVTPEFLPYLRRYRKSRGLPPFPEQNEEIPILEASHGRPGLSVRQIRSIVKEALMKAHASITSTDKGGEHWNILLGGSMRFLKESGAKIRAQSFRPAELQKYLGIFSLAYTYGRYYG